MRKNLLIFDWKTILITILSTIFLIFDSYYKMTPWKFVDRTILYFIFPLLIIILVFRENPKDYGFTIGDWKAGISLIVICILLISPIIWIVGKGDTGMKNYYEGQLSGLPWSTFADLFGWEFFFRGWILFGYYKKFGAEALWLQAVPFSLAHIGKPGLETLSTIFGGFIFGWIAWKTKSFFYPFIIHWFVSTFTILVASGYVN